MSEVRKSEMSLTASPKIERLPGKLDNVYFSGTLLKKDDGRMAQWHEKCFELTGATLTYTASNQSKKSFNISSACMENTSKPPDAAPFTFALMCTFAQVMGTNAGRVHLQCETLELKLQWAQHLFFSMEYSSNPSLTVMQVSTRVADHMKVFRASNVSISCPPASTSNISPRPSYNAEGNFCGFLMKRTDGGLLASWKTKWITIKVRELAVEVSGEGKPPKTYPLADSYIERTEVPNPSMFTFALSGPFGRVHFAADSPEVQVIWFMMVEEFVAKANPTRLVSTAVPETRRDLSPEHRVVQDDFSGWLWKKGSNTWHKRYVTVKDGKMTYCEEEPSKFVATKHHMKTFVLNEEVQVEVLADHKQKFPLLLRFGSSDSSAGVIFAATSFDERLSFCETITRNKEMKEVGKSEECLESMLMKRGDDALSSWKWKYVRLVGQTLTYYTAKNVTSGMKTISLLGTSIKQCDDITSSLFPFALNGLFGRLFFAAESAELRMLWVAVLEDAIAYANSKPKSKQMHVMRLAAAARAKNPKVEVTVSGFEKNPRLLENGEGDDEESSAASEGEVTGAHALVQKDLDADTAALVASVGTGFHVSGYLDVYPGVGQPGRRLWCELLNGVMSLASDPEKYPVRRMTLTLLDNVTFSLEGPKIKKMIFRAEDEKVRNMWEKNLRISIALHDPKEPLNRTVLEQQRFSSVNNEEHNNFSDASEEEEDGEKVAGAYLLKRQREGSAWHKRWVVVTRDEVMTYKSHSSLDHEKGVLVSAGSTVKEVPAADDVEFCFVIESGEVTTFFGTTDGTDHKTMLAAVRNLIIKKTS